MSNELPESFYIPAERERQRSVWITWVAVCAAVISGWHVFGLPGNLIHLYRLPEDMPHYGFGLTGVTINPEGEWIIRRTHYADRMGRYTIRPSGELLMQEDHGTEVERDRSGGLKSSGVYMSNGHTLKIFAGRSTMQMIRRDREEALTSKGIKLPAAGFSMQMKPEVLPVEPPAVNVTVYSAHRTERFSVLSGQHYFEMIDDACFHDPYIWITTGRLDKLHRLFASDTGHDDPLTTDTDESIKVRELTTVDLKLPQQQNDTSLGIDPATNRLYLLTALGDRHWFDPQTLAALGQDRLPGNWEPEYAVIAATRSRDGYPAYDEGAGLPLTRQGYERLMQSLVLVFLASLVVLAVRWRKPWRYISEATTAATPSSSRSLNI